jgi:hypothetical protein
MRKCLFLIFCLISLFFACQDAPKDHLQYLFLGHIYRYHDYKTVDTRIEKLDRSQFDGFWLGGDICMDATREESILDYLDDLFDLSNENTHWAVGNHDVRNGNVQWITNRTKRPTFYTKTKNDITYFVMDTNLGFMKKFKDKCEEKHTQTELLRQVLDTIQHSSHLIILTHHVIWGGIPGIKGCYEIANACAPFYSFRCDTTLKFYPKIYKELTKVQKRGVQVIVVSGDGGQQSKGYHFISNDSMHFLMSGINNSLDLKRAPAFYQDKDFNFNPDSVLIFHHYPKKRELTWEFRNLNEMVEN